MLMVASKAPYRTHPGLGRGPEPIRPGDTTRGPAHLHAAFIGMLRRVWQAVLGACRHEAVEHCEPSDDQRADLQSVSRRVGERFEVGEDAESHKGHGKRNVEIGDGILCHGGEHAD